LEEDAVKIKVTTKKAVLEFLFPPWVGKAASWIFLFSQRPT